MTDEYNHADAILASQYGEGAKSNIAPEYSHADTILGEQFKTKAGLAAKAVNTGQALGRLAYDLPGNAAGYAANLAEGSRPLDENNWADEAATGANERLQQRILAPDANDPTLLGTKADWAQTGASIPFSAGSGLAAAGAGALTGIATKNPVAAYGAGASAAGVLAHRADSAMFMRNALDGYTQKYQQENGVQPSQDELLAEQERLQPYAMQHGLAEAIPEGLGAPIGAKLVGSVFNKSGGNIVKRGLKAAAGIAAEELPTETVTQMAQHNIEANAGVTGEQPRDWTSAEDWGKSLGEVATPVIQQSLLMSGGAVAASKAYDYGKGVLGRALEAGQPPAQANIPAPASGLAAWAKPGYKINPDANAIVSNQTIPGTPTQQGIDEQYQNPGAYNPLAGNWQTPSTTVNANQATRSPSEPAAKQNADDLVRRQSVPGKPLQKAIDTQYQNESTYNPLSGNWETPNADIKTRQPGLDQWKEPSANIKTRQPGLAAWAKPQFKDNKNPIYDRENEVKPTQPAQEKPTGSHAERDTNASVPAGSANTGSQGTKEKPEAASTSVGRKDAEFVPTHELSDGLPVKATDQPGVYVDQHNNEFEDDYAVPVSKKPESKTDLGQKPEQGSSTQKAALPPILTKTKGKYINDRLAEEGLNPEATGYDAKKKSYIKDYESDLTDAFDGQPYEVYNNHPENKSPDSELKRRAWESLQSSHNNQDANIQHNQSNIDNGSNDSHISKNGIADIENKPNIKTEESTLPTTKKGEHENDSEQKLHESQNTATEEKPQKTGKGEKVNDGWSIGRGGPNGSFETYTKNGNQIVKIGPQSFSVSNADHPTSPSNSFRTLQEAKNASEAKTTKNPTVQPNARTDSGGNGVAVGASKTPAAISGENITQPEAIKALESGVRIIRHGDTVWIEEIKKGLKGQTYVIKTMDSEGNAFVKGPAGPDVKWGWSSDDAARKAIESWNLKIPESNQNEYIPPTLDEHIAEIKTPAPEWWSSASGESRKAMIGAIGRDDMASSSVDILWHDLSQNEQLKIYAKMGQKMPKPEKKPVTPQVIPEPKTKQPTKDFIPKGTVLPYNRTLGTVTRASQIRTTEDIDLSKFGRDDFVGGLEILGSNEKWNNGEIPISLLRQLLAEKLTGEVDRVSTVEVKSKAEKLIDAAKGNGKLEIIHVKDNSKPVVSDNTIYTEDAAEKARALLKSKLGQVRSGLDPEMFNAGITLAGYHIEKGARTFAAYAQSMVDDLGEMIKPYLKQFYLGVMFDPSAISLLDSMDSAASVQAANIDEIFKKGAENEPVNDGKNSKGTLEGVLPGALSVDGETREIDTGVGSGSRSDESGNGRPEADRLQRVGSVGGVETTVHSDEAGRELAGIERDVAKEDFFIDDDHLGYGTYGEKLAANMTAIRLIKKLESEDRKPDQEEKVTLSKFIGWGSLKNVFNPNSKAKQDREAYKELEGLLTDNEMFWAKQGVLAQHFTSPEVIGGIYDVLDHMGFKGGYALEPTVGVGNFIGGMPTRMKSTSAWYGSEIDPIVGKIAKYLYPESTILDGVGFQDAEFPYNKFDLVIGNPPFGDEQITDKNPKRKAISGLKIHNYIISKSAMHLRPGGIMPFVVTNRFLDTANGEARDYLAENFNLLAAIRLPNNAFKKNAGTEVTTDIVFLQKRMPGQAVGNEDWFNTKGQLEHAGEKIRLNEYFANRPEMMLGTPSMAGTMYGSGLQFTLNPHEGKTIAEGIKGLIDGPLADLKNILKSDAAIENKSIGIQMNREDVAIDGYTMEKGNIFIRRDDDAEGNATFEKLTPRSQWTENAELGEKRYERIKGMLGLREKAYELINAERNDAENIEALRTELNNLYDNFVKKYGFINNGANESLMRKDIKIEQGLEKNFKAEITKAKAKGKGLVASPEKAEKSDLMEKRLFFPKKEILAAANARDGYSVSLSEKGRVDLPYIAELTGLPLHQVMRDLGMGDDPLIFQDPNSVLPRFIQEDEYLSGNVKRKLKEAQDAGLDINVKALKAVLPKDLETNEIFADIGQTWIRPEHYEQFLDELGVSGAKVVIDNTTGNVTAVKYGNVTLSSIGKQFENGDYSMPELFNLVSNKKPVVAYDVTRDSKRVNPERTKGLQVQAKRLTALFRDWIFADTQRAKELTKIYNDEQNTTIERKSDGRHLRTVGANVSKILRDTQKNAAWRMIQNPVILLDHVVGAGKTMTIITGIMERVRLGLSKKPMIIVPNHLVGQWAKEFYELYPGANILAASEKDFAKPNRRRFFSRIATGQYDAIIIGHSSFKFIKVEPEKEQAFIMQELEHLQMALDAAKENEDRRSVRTIQNRIAKRRDKLHALNIAPKDDVVSFQQMGIDYLAVDESHAFKNLEYATGISRVAGMGNPAGSQMAFDLYMKIRGLLDDDNGGVAFATGTPISNSLVEMYSIMRYLNKPGLQERRIEAFDAWAKNYASVDSVIEYMATGKLKERSVMGSFNNVPEMMQLYRAFADIVTMKDLKRIYAEQVRAKNKATGDNEREEFPVPKILGGSRELIKVPASAEQTEYMDYLIERTLNVEADMKTKDFDPKKDNILWIYNDAKKAALDMRLVDPTAPDNPNSKVNKAVDEIMHFYHEWEADKGTQLVFIDLSTPKKNATKVADKLLKETIEKAGITPGSREEMALNQFEGYQKKWSYLKSKLEDKVESETEDGDKAEKLQAFIDKIDEDSANFITADVGFSVYDDIKKKLIDKGIPASEVHFIHDYNTANDKKDLFAMVNSGSVRVLLGSTAKMGAGTNAQERLVALHHIDASQHNRPSDIEQREGRIIRQGNKLYERDPEGFRVALKAYSTEKTFDAVSWQTLAKKAGMLESFRNGARKIEEGSNDAASYLEFMAETTGNPIFREKVRLESEISELEADERRITAQLSAANRTIKNEEKDSHYNQRKLANAEHAANSIGDASTMEVDGKTYKNDYAAEYKKEFPIWEQEQKDYHAAMEEYAVARDEWEKKEKGDRGRAPKKPVEPEPIGLFSDRMQSKSQGAKFAKILRDNILDLDKVGRTTEFKIGALLYTAEREKDRYSKDKDLISVEDEFNQTDFRFQLNPLTLDEKISSMLNKFEPEMYKYAVKYRKREIADHIKQVAISKEFVNNNEFNGAELLKEKRLRFEHVKSIVDNVEQDEAERRHGQPNKYIQIDSLRFPDGSPRGRAPTGREPVEEPDPESTDTGGDGRNYLYGKNVYHFDQQGHMVPLNRPVDDIQYSRGESPGSIVKNLTEALPRRLKAMLASGKLKIVQSHNSDSQGFYNASDDTITLVADNIAGGELNSVLAHELFHRAELTDPETRTAIARFDQQLANSFNRASKGIGSDVEIAAAYRVVMSGTSEKNRLSEYKAYLVSEYSKAPDSFSGMIKRAIDNFIAAIRATLVRSGLDMGFIKALTPADLVALSKYGARSGSLAGKVGKLSRETLASKTGTFSPNSDNILYSFGSPITSMRTQGESILRKYLNEKNKDSFIYNFQDRFIDLKRQMEKIVKNGGDITEDIDPRLKEEVYHQSRAYKIDQFFKQDLQPILKELHDYKIDMAKFQQFLHARHAPSRNAVMSGRNPNQDIIDRNLKQAEDNFDALKKSLLSTQDELTEARREVSKWRNAKPFHGTEEERLSLSGMSNQESRDFMSMLTGPEHQAMNRLGDKIDKINNDTLDLLVEYGLETQDTIDALKSQWQHYVPLHRDEAHAEENNFGHPIGRGFSVRGTGMQNATGSNAEVTNILAHIMSAREQMITRGEKNKVTKSLADLITAHPDSDFATIDKMEVENRLNKDGLVEPQVEPIFKRNTKDNVVMYRVYGKDHAIVFNDKSAENIRLAMSLKNLDGQALNTVEQFFSKGTRWLAAVNTQYNLVFGIFNLMRDTQGMALNLTSTPLHGQQKQIITKIPAAIKAIWNIERGNRIDPTMQALYERFNQAGGTTGYAQMFDDIKDRNQKLQDEIDKFGASRAIRAKHWIGQFLSDFNTMMENSTRLATFIQGVNSGMSDTKAASLSKNITVNFNRKGAKTTEIGAMYAFFNASMQGSARMIKTLQGPQGKNILAGGVAFGAIMTIIAITSMGADDWEKIPEFVRERSLIIPLGTDGKYLAVPMPLGFHIIPNIGRKFAESFMGSNLVTPQHRFSDLAGTITGAFNPLGGRTFMEMITPTLADPAMSLYANRDWTGKPIYREDFDSLKPTPGFTRAKDSATWLGKFLAKQSNTLTGGTDYMPGAWSPTPDQIDYLFGQILGGTGRELGHIQELSSAPFNGDEIQTSKIPLVGKLYGEASGNAAERSAFYDNLKSLNQHHAEIQGLRKEAGGGTKAMAYINANPESKLYHQATAIHEQISAMKARRARMEKLGKPIDVLRVIDSQIIERMKAFNDKYSAAIK